MGKKKTLIIVESPAKAKTIEGILGKDFKVLASYGHIRDLPKNEFGVELKNFEPKFELIPGKKKIVSIISKEINGRRVLLASDMDREGEAIAWHISDVLSLPKNGIRITFTEITPRSIKKAIENVRDIDMRLVRSQFARRILDRIVGYKISPLLWKIFRINNLSAGRVQSAVLKMICEGERKIFNFEPLEYWRAKFNLDGIEFELVRLSGKKINKDLPEDVLDELRTLKELVVKSVIKSIVKKKPPDPFTTSTLQQAAASQLHFSVKKTMSIAQQLYEGLDTNEGHRAFITYHRTDSTRIASEAREAAVEFIEENFGKEYVGFKGRTRKAKGKIQDAHEAIRPVDVGMTPDKVKTLLPEDHWKLYSLVWKRFVASQMSSSEYEEIKMVLTDESGKFGFEGKIQRLIFDGFERVLPREKKDSELNLKEGDRIPVEIRVFKDKTKPPDRFSEGSLVREMERVGIGRPSTYAPTISTLLNRKYVVKRRGKLFPTLMGFLVLDYLEKNFPEIVDVKFTARMEEKLDLVESGQKAHTEVLNEFFEKFNESLEKAKSTFYRVDYKTDFKCECGDEMHLVTGKYGVYLKCSSCGKTRSIKPDYTAVLVEDKFYFPWRRDDGMAERKGPTSESEKSESRGNQR